MMLTLHGTRSVPIFALVVVVVTFVVTVSYYWGFHGGVIHPFIQNEIEIEGAYREKILRERLVESEDAYQKSVQKRRLFVGHDPSKIHFWPPGQGAYLWEYLLPCFSCPYTIQKIGTIGDGGKWVCGMELYDKEKRGGPPPQQCVIYSFGVGGESSFEAELLKRTDCEIYAYDESVDKMGPHVSMRESRVHFNRVYISNSTTLRTLMKRNNHQFIDFLKLDIEGHEFEVLDQIMDDFEILPFAQLAVEIHTDEGGKLFPELYKLWERMEAKGLRPFKNEMNHIACLSHENPRFAEYAFINTKGHSRLLPP